MLALLTIGRKAVPLLNILLNIRSNELFGLVIFAGLFLVAGFSETIHVPVRHLHGHLHQRRGMDATQRGAAR
jgi:hypothetical protein